MRRDVENCSYDNVLYQRLTEFAQQLPRIRNSSRHWWTQRRRILLQKQTTRLLTRLSNTESAG